MSQASCSRVAPRRLPLLSLLPVFTWGAESQLEPRKLFLTSFRESRFEWDFGEFFIGESRTWTPICLVWLSVNPDIMLNPDLPT